MNIAAIISYDTNQRRARGKRLLRRTLFALGSAFIIALIVIGDRYGRPIIDKFVFPRLQQQCLDYAPTVELPVFEFTFPGMEPSIPPGLIRGQYGPMKIYCRPALEWNAFRSHLTGHFTCTDNIIFMHERHCLNGPSRLIVVQLHETEVMHSGAYPVCVTVIEPATLTSPAKVLKCESKANYNNTAIGAINEVMYVRSNTCIYADHIDDADPSHFTLNYELQGVKLRLDGNLGLDDSIRLAIHNIPRELSDKGINVLKD